MALTEQTTTGTQLPAPGTYAIDASHSGVEFSVRHLGLSKVRGRFAAFSGDVTIAEEPTASSVEVSIDIASVDTRDEGRDTHLRGADFFDAEQFPTMTFRSTGVRPAGRDWQVDGELTIRGVTRPVTLDVEFEGSATDPWGNDRIGFSASTEVNREDFGLTWNQALETGGVLVGKKVKIDLAVEAVKA